MAKRKRKTARVGWLAVTCLVFCVGAGAYYLTRNLGFQPVRPTSKPEVKPPVVKPVVQTREVTIFVSEDNGNSTYLVPVTGSTDAKGDILDVALKTLIDTNKTENSAAMGLIPVGTKSLKPVKVKGDLAIVDLSTEFVDNFNGGSDQEALTLNSIAHTLVINSKGNVRRVQILVEGEPAETLGGHFELTDPITADATLLRPGNRK